ncbi:MAG: extracellular catalytic domain type 1 short-chain-length polyhydroxyalkanoate depolymerase [Planctomycetota bacterium]|jgi:polyhydroxybutyrate depolymerase
MMKKKISLQYSSLHVSSRRMIFVFVILLFVSQSILHAQIQTGTIDFDGRLRDYMVYLPNNYTGSINFPLVIYLHSYGSTAQRGMSYTKLNQVADASDFIVVYPSGIPNWNSDVGDNSRYPTPDVDDVGFINALIDTMSNNYSIDLERIYACGYSNGGAMAYRLAFQLSHRIAAIASVGGIISISTAESLNPVRPVPVLEIHGTSDTIVPINGSTVWLSVDQTLSYWTSFNDCVQADTTILPDLDPTDGCTVEKVTYTNCSDNSNVVYYKVINGGHTWPGAGPPGFSAGKTNQDVNASVEIWNFFKNHKLLTHPVVDFNGDGIVDIKDLLRLIQSWGQDDPMVDIAPPFGDGVVDVLDLEVLMSYWGQEVEDPTLIAHWKLDETEGDIAYDSAAVNDAVVFGGAVWQPAGGAVDGALEFDGMDDYVSTPYVLNPADGPFSVFAWANGGAPGQVIISQTGGMNWLSADSAGGNLMTEHRFIGGRVVQPPLLSQMVITDGQWHRIGFVWDGAYRALYVDDSIVAEDSQPGLADSLGGLNIGCGSDLAAGTFFSGLIDDIRVYNRAVTP